MKVAILFDEIKPQDVLDDKDVMQQVEVVVNSLKRLGHSYVLIPCTLNLGDIKDQILSEAPDVVFNALDTLDSQDCLSHLPVALCDALRVRHTGPDAISLSVATRKLLAKDWMWEAEIPTPNIIIPYRPHPSNSKDVSKWIIKAANEDGSYGMDDKSVVEGVFMDVQRIVEEKTITSGRTFFAEKYIDGREFTVPFLCGKTLPVIEIIYQDYPEGKPKILSQAAKWQPESFESKHTGTAFIYDAGKYGDVAYRMSDISLQCIELFRLRGWGRIDFRVGENEGQVPYVIDVNANSCLAPDAWWAESLEKAGITFDQAITQILQDTK